MITITKLFTIALTFLTNTENVNALHRGGNVPPLGPVQGGRAIIYVNPDIRPALDNNVVLNNRPIPMEQPFLSPDYSRYYRVELPLVQEAPPAARPPIDQGFDSSNHTKLWIFSICIVGLLVIRQFLKNPEVKADFQANLSECLDKTDETSTNINTVTDELLSNGNEQLKFYILLVLLSLVSTYKIYKLLIENQTDSKWNVLMSDIFEGSTCLD